jgi:hypothetical protein
MILSLAFVLVLYEVVPRLAYIVGLVVAGRMALAVLAFVLYRVRRMLRPSLRARYGAGTWAVVIDACSPLGVCFTE